MKAKIVLVCLVFALLLSGFQSARAEAQPVIAGQTGILIDAKTGNTLYEKHPDRAMYPASTTKIMTALLAIEHGQLDQMVTVGSEVHLIGWDSSRAGLQPGDQLSLRDLLYGLMLPSGNDAAYAVAVHVARAVTGNPKLPAAAAVSEFSRLMNQRAKELGATNTNFVNPDGYPHPNHYTSARDLALIAAAATANPQYREIDSASRHTAETWGARTWHNGNYLINPNSRFFYREAEGGKTGYTVPAGFTMVATAANDEMELVAVTLRTSADGRWTDTTRMFEYGFSNFRRHQLADAGQIVTSTAATASDHWQQLVAIEPVEATVPLGSEGRIEAKVLLNPGTPLKEGVQAGETVGQVVYSLDGRELQRTGVEVKSNHWLVNWLHQLTR